MKENDYSIDDVFDTRKRISKNDKIRNKRKKKISKKRIILISGILLIILIIGLCTYLFMKRKPISNDNLVYRDFEPLVSKINDNEYYIFGAKKDISFEVEMYDNFSYKVLDEDNNEITVNEINNDNKVTIKAPNDLYKEGKTYKIEINNGKFTNELYKDGKTIIFNILRASTNTYKLKDNTILLDNSSITVKDNNLVTNNNYKVNDIILTKDNNKLMNGYRIDKINKSGNYQVSIPKLNEIFDDIDYYGMEKVNLAMFATNDELKSYLVATIKNNIINSLVNTVYAKSNVEINGPIWNKSKQTLEFVIKIDTNENSKVFNSDFLKNHKSIIEYNVIISANLYKNVTLDNYDYALEFIYTFNNKVNLNSINNNLNTLNDSIKNNTKEYDANWLVNDYKNIISDKVDINKSLGNIMVETEVPGLYVLLDEEINFNSDIKAIINASTNGTIKSNVGINSKGITYGNITYIGDGNITMIGDGMIQTGYNSKSSLLFLNMVKLNTDTRYGLYVNGSSNISVNNKQEDEKEFDYQMNANNCIYIKHGINGIIDGKEFSKTIYDEKKELKKYEKKAKFIIKEEKDTKEKDDGKQNTINKDDIRQKIQNGYDEINKNDEWSNGGGTFVVSFNYSKTIDVSKNIFTTTWTYDDSVSYTCNYDYVNKTMSCSDYDKALAYVKNACNSLYNEYLKYKETGETDNDDAAEWENIYDSLDTCYYEAIPETLPTDFNEDIDKILKQVQLTNDDLLLLK